MNYWYSEILTGKRNCQKKTPEYIRFEDMSRYAHHLQRASGLIFCSLHEGLGIPAIEAMLFRCPLLLSDIPSLREICEGYACFVNPLDINNITNGMNELINNQDYWIEKSKEGKEHYKSLSENSGKKILKIYKRFQ